MGLRVLALMGIGDVFGWKEADGIVSDIGSGLGLALLELRRSPLLSLLFDDGCIGMSSYQCLRTIEAHAQFRRWGAHCNTVCNKG